MSLIANKCKKTNPIMKFYYLIIISLIANSLSIFADEKDDDQEVSIEHLSGEPLFVSLGSHCETCYTIRECNLRKAAFPLDWVISFNGDHLIRLLDEDFRNFEEFDFLIPQENGTFVNTYYNLEFIHDGSCFESFLNKYRKRIERFRNLRDYSGKVIFVRYGYIYPYKNNGTLFFNPSKNGEMNDFFSERLYESLERYFPNLDLTLVIINIHNRWEIEFERELHPKLLKYRANPFVPTALKIEYFKILFNSLIHTSMIQ